MIKLLVATDLSQRSVHAVQRAARLVQRQGGGDWTLLHVVDDDGPQAFVAEHVQRVQALLDEQAQQLAKQVGSRPRVVVSSGEVEGTIVEATLALGADLLLVGAQRQFALRDLFVGSTVERLIRGSHLPVLRVAAPATSDYRHALAALDLSPISAQALDSALRLGLIEPQHCEALHALEPLPMGMLAEGGVDYRLFENRASETLQALRTNLQGAGVMLEQGRVRVQEGAPRQVIADALRQSQADLLVVGSHARKGLSRLALGSVASALLADLACDILCVPPRA